MTLEETLKERDSRYGGFADFSEISQDLKRIGGKAFRRNEHEFTDYQIEALDMICHKLARILSGDPDYIDSWLDIAGYATLVVQQLEIENRTSKP